MDPEYEHRISELTAANDALRSRIADQERVLSELVKQKEILQRIFDHVPMMIAMLGPDGRFKLVNRAWESTLGWTLEEILTHDINIFKEVYPDPEDLERVRNFVAASGGQWEDFKSRLRDGRTLQSSWFQFRFPDGSHFAVGQDITERKQAEEALREAQESFRQVTENIEELFWIKTPDFKRLLYMSPNYERITGIDPERHFEADGVQFLLDLIHPDDRARVAEIMRRADGKEFEIEFRLIAPDGSLRWIRERGFPIYDRSGELDRIAGIAENITGRKLAEDRLKATSEQLRALSASVQSAREEERARIAREIHDELGSGLTSLKWDLEGLDKAFSEPLEPSRWAALREKTASMMKLADGIIRTVRRIASELRPSILDDLGLVEAIEWQARQFQSRTGIVCRLSRSIATVDLTQDQSTAIFRIFQEALTNVLRHAQASRVDIAMEEDDGFLLAITDNGRGITEQEKTDQSSLGLLGMRERAHLVGAKVDIAGVSGSGTVITIRLPLGRAAAAAMVRNDRNETPSQRPAQG